MKEIDFTYEREVEIIKIVKKTYLLCRRRKTKREERKETDTKYIQIMKETDGL